MTLKFGDLPREALRRRLARGLTLTTGPFRFRLQSRHAGVAEGLAMLYADFPVEEDTGYRDFHVRVDRVRGLRRWFRPQVNFWVDGHAPFKPLPADHAFTLLEWGMNWCIASHAHHYLLLHAAVLERRDRTVILPGDNEQDVRYLPDYMSGRLRLVYVNDIQEALAAALV